MRVYLMTYIDKQCLHKQGKLSIKIILLQEREKLVLTRVVVFEVVQALKFKTSIPDENFLMLINFILQV